MLGLGIRRASIAVAQSEGASIIIYYPSSMQITLMVLHWLKHRIARETKDKKVRGKREWSLRNVAIAIIIFAIIATAIGLAATQSAR